MSGILKRWFFAVLFLAFILALLAGFFPLLVEEFVLPPVLAKFGLADYKFSVSRLGLNGCSLHITGRPQLTSPVVSGNINMDWTPSGLYLRRIDRVSSNGLQINLVDLPKNKDTAQLPDKSESLDKRISLPIIVEQVEVNNGALFYHAGDRIVYLPFTFSGQRTGDANLADPTGAVYFQARIQSAENEVNASVALNTSDGTLTGKLATNLELGSLASIIPLLSSSGIELQGHGQLIMETVMQLSPFTVKQLKTSFKSEDLLLTGNGFSILTQDTLPAEITISGSGGNFQVNGTGLHVAGPLQASVDFDALISHVENDLQWKGLLEIKPGAGPIFQDRIVLQDAQPVRVTHTGLRNAEGMSIRLTTGLPEKSEEQRAVVLKYKDITFDIEELGVDARISSTGKQAQKTSDLTLLVQGRNGSVMLPQGLVMIPKFALQAAGSSIPEQEGYSFAGQFNLEDASLNMEGKNVRLSGVQLELPVTWPYDENVERKGSLGLDEISFDANNLGSLTAQIIQEGKGLAFDGFLRSPLFPGEKISLNGNLRLPEDQNSYGELAFSLVDTNIAMSNLTSILPALQGMSGNGTVNAQGNLAISSCGLSGQADLALKNGSLYLEEAETELEDIGFSLRLPTLPNITSAPRQQITIGTIKKKKFVINNVKTWYQIESPTSLFIEKISGHWSGGRVFTSSFRLQKGQDELDVALFCDRLELSSILSQFNLAEAGGEGKLSGRVPLVYNEGKFFVDDGFLFSTPGEKGHLKIKQSKYLETTIPANVPQFSPLHFAGAALADFEYNWAKLQINSEKENLLLKLKVDGKPKDKLPFRFDTKKNAFVRLEDESKGGIDQPIRLDVNFNVPVNEMFQYKDKVRPLLKLFN